MSYNYDILIEQISESRKKANMSQRALAYACNMPQSTLARIETKKTVPQIDTLLKIADVLKMDLKLEKRESDIPEVKRWDGLKFCVYWKDEIISKVQVHRTEADITRFILHPMKQLFWSDSMNILQLSQVFEDRCWERNRDDIHEILNNIGLTSYDPLEIVKKTHGISYNDFLWFQFEGENYSYKDMMTRRCKIV